MLFIAKIFFRSFSKKFEFTLLPNYFIKIIRKKSVQNPFTSPLSYTMLFVKKQMKPFAVMMEDGQDEWSTAWTTTIIRDEKRESHETDRTAV